jgi:SAM-dependent methyltransferase
MESSDKQLQQARIHAQAQWNANPCGALPTELYDRQYFEKVEEERYRQQYWQKEFFDFNSFRGGRVLEIGVGHGTDLKQFARNGAYCYGVDITETHLSLARQNFATEGLIVELKQSDATKLPFADNYFDCVYSFGVIHHIPDVNTVLAEVHRVLKPGAILQIAVYHLFSVHTLALFLRAIMTGKIFRIGIAGVLSTIESGADGVLVKPYVKLYSPSGLARLLKHENFRVLKVGVRQVNFDNSRSLNFLRRFEKIVGWYVCALVAKNEASASSNLRREHP